MTTAPDVPAHWIHQIEAVLTEVNPSLASQQVSLPMDMSAVWRWINIAVLPLISTVGALRAENTRDAKSLMNQTDLPSNIRDAHLRAVWQMQARLAFPYDDGFERAYDSAIAFAQDNSDMIKEHFGNAENYAEYYAQTNTDAMKGFCERTVGVAAGDALVTALQQNDPTLFSQSFPGAFLRGLLCSYHAALGPKSPVELAHSLHLKLNEAIVDKTPS
ncbi:MAG: hypothetical protein ACSHXB_17275 [Sulfitobacter sp.]